MNDDFLVVPADGKLEPVIFLLIWPAPKLDKHCWSQTIIHLNVHSNFSLLQATPGVEALANRAAGDGLTHLALTDSHALYGAVSFDHACRRVGVQPIIGMTLRLADTLPGELTLLATGPVGYGSLNRLSAAVQAKPDRVDRLSRGLAWERLRENHHGLLCLSGGRNGPVEIPLRQGDATAAYNAAARLAHLFDDRAALALEIHSRADEAVAHAVTNIAHRLGLSTAAVQPIYYLDPTDRNQRRLLAAIDRNQPLKDIPALDPALHYHWRSPAEMATLFANFPQAIPMTAELAARCKPALPDGNPIWPGLDLPPNQTPADALTTLTTAGMQRHYGDNPASVVVHRLQTELQVIISNGFAPLFLIVADIVRFARRNAIPVNTRGSVANALTAYCAGITTIDPVANNLLFERFLNPARANLPDIDLDFCSRRRDRILNYVRERYGADRVAQVGAMTTFGLRSAIRETAKAYQLEKSAIKRLTAGLPRWRHPDPNRRQIVDSRHILAEAKNDTERTVLKEALAIVGLPHHLSVHPGGVVITPGPLTDTVPVQWATKGFIITQFSHNDVETIGLPKLDLLGTSALTVLADAADLLRRDTPAFDPDTIPRDDGHTARMLAAGETIGVFQCESIGAQTTLRKLKAQTVTDLAVANAFFKPGPATGGMARQFVRRYRGEEQATLLHPTLADILGPTQGILLFQEQVLRVGREIAGLSWAEADELRRGMSKFQEQAMSALAAQFITGCTTISGFTPAQAETLWEQVKAFAGYGFNQGHALAYADLSYRLAWLKAHHPTQLFAARLASYGGFHHPAVYIAEARRLGITIKPPHVNHSHKRATLSNNIIWLGLGLVRDLRRQSIQTILTVREEHPYRSLADLLQRVSLSNKEISHLIKIGALDGLEKSRGALLASLAGIERGGDVRQLALPFDTVDTAPAQESPAERLAWEISLLGMPVSLTPLDALLSHAQTSENLLAYRLPGWGGSRRGVYLSDGLQIIWAEPVKGSKALPVWHVGRWHGNWIHDNFGSSWYRITGVDACA